MKTPVRVTSFPSLGTLLWVYYARLVARLSYLPHMHGGCLASGKLRRPRSPEAPVKKFKQPYRGLG